MKTILKDYQNNQVSDMLKDVPIPKMFKARQEFPRPAIEPEDIPLTIHNLLWQEPFCSMIKPGMRIAITAGSRGIANIPVIIRSLADFVKERGGIPFVVPAMGSHGGATAEGQVAVLESYGITEEFIGCEILSSMETVVIGQTEDGRNVRMDKFASEADGIIVSCRIKPHTGFRGPIESGIMKMLAIGLGKQAGAMACHNEGFGKMAKNVPLFGQTIIDNAPVLFAVPVLENAYDQTCKIVAVNAKDIAAKEPALLKEAFGYMPRILVDECDILIVDAVGKYFSGSGMDPNITGTFATPYATGGIKSQHVAVLDVSEDSHGHAQGVGLATVTTKRLIDKADLEKMYMNAITSLLASPVRLPIIALNDKEAIQYCNLLSTGIDRERARIVRISNSLELEYIWLSEAYYQEALMIPNLTVVSEPEEMPFDEHGNLW